MIIVMYLVGLLIGLGIWFLTHCVKSEPKIKFKRGVIHWRLANQGQQPTPPISAMPPLTKPKK